MVKSAMKGNKTRLEIAMFYKVIKKALLIS